MSALSKGYVFAMANPEEAADILIAQNPELADSRDLVVASQRFLAEEYKADAARWGEFDADSWNGFYNWLAENQLLESPIAENVGFTNDYLPQ